MACAFAFSSAERTLPCKVTLPRMLSTWIAVPLTPSVVRRASLVFVVIQASGVAAQTENDQNDTDKVHGFHGALRSFLVMRAAGAGRIAFSPPGESRSHAPSYPARARRPDAGHLDRGPALSQPFLHGPNALRRLHTHPARLVFLVLLHVPSPQPHSGCPHDRSQDKGLTGPHRDPPRL